MGIGHPRESRIQNSEFRMRNVDDYVLGMFSGAERGKARELVKHGAKAISFALEESLEAAMNRFNAK